MKVERKGDVLHIHYNCLEEWLEHERRVAKYREIYGEPETKDKTDDETNI